MGQVSLFASLGDETNDFSGVQYQLIGNDQEYSDKELQLLEKEFLGFYITQDCNMSADVVPPRSVKNAIFVQKPWRSHTS